MFDFERAQKNYDKYSLKYIKKVNINSNLIYIKNVVFELFEPKKTQKILHIGCGDGAECLPFIKKGAEIVGIDSSYELIALARKKYAKSKANFYVIDYEKTFFSNKTFDGIISIMSIMYKKNLTKVLLELKRILKPDGKIIIVVPHPIRKMIKYSNFNYFRSGLQHENCEGVERFNYYRTIEEYFCNIQDSNLYLKQILEPKPQLDKPYHKTNGITESLYPHALIFVLKK